MEAAGCSEASASDCRRGKRTPHVSTWAPLAPLVGCVRSVPAGNPTETWNRAADRDHGGGWLFRGVRVRLPAWEADAACFDVGALSPIGGMCKVCSGGKSYRDLEPCR